MEKEKEKGKYESPFTKETQVNLESGICASSASVENPEGDNGQIEGHDKNTEFGGDWANGGYWD